MSQHDRAPLKVLFITYTGLNENLGRSQILPYIKALAERGIRFSVLSFEPATTTDKERKQVSEFMAGLPVDFTFLERPKRGLLFNSAYLLAGFRIALRLARKNRCDLVHCRNFVAAEYAMMLRQVLGLPFLFDMRGFWGDARRESGVWDQKKAFYRFVYKAWKSREYKYIYRSAMTNTLTYKARDWTVSEVGKSADKITVTPCCVDFDHCEGVWNHSDTIRRDLGLNSEDFLCIYSGSLGGVYDDKRIFSVFSYIRQTKSHAKLLLLGSHIKNHILREASSLGITLDDQSVLSLSVPHDRVFAIYGCANLGLSFYRPGFYAQGVSSTKVGEYLSVGLPFIANAGIGDLQLTAESLGGNLILPDTPSAADIQMIHAFVDGITLIDRMALRARARERFHLDIAIDSYFSAYKKIAGET